MSVEGPKNGIYIVLGEINLLLTHLKRNFKYGSSPSHYEMASQDPLFRNFYELKAILNDHSDLSEIDPSTFLAPFLEVIKSEETTGPVTAMALISVNKFISYGLISLHSETVPACVQQIADSITHARFVGTDTSNDEVVLMKILQVLRTLMLNPIGYHLTNSSVCEIMQSCFQICFEARLTELLRRVAESILVDMVQLLFARLPHFKDDAYKYSSVKKLTMKSGADTTQRQKKAKKPRASPSKQTFQDTNSTITTVITTTTTVDPVTSTPDVVPLEETTATSSLETSSDTTTTTTTDPVQDEQKINLIASVSEPIEQQQQVPKSIPEPESPGNDYVNTQGVRFVQETNGNASTATTKSQSSTTAVISVPFGLPCVRELLRFLISLISSKNADVMVSMGLNLLTVAFESGVDHIASYPSLLSYVKDDLCRHLCVLLGSERLGVYASTLRVSFLLFESLRGHLKLQIEFFFTKIMDIITNDTNKILPEQREMTIDYLLQVLRIPGFAIEMYLNYDCSLNCSNLFEDVTKLLSKTAFSVQSLLTANSLSLSALLTIVDNIELENTSSLKPSASQVIMSGAARMPPSSGFSSAATQYRSTASTATTAVSTSAVNLRVNRMQVVNEQLPTQEELRLTRQKKRLLTQGVDLFNQSPSKGVQFLRDNRIFSSDDHVFMQQLIKFLRDTPTLDKKILGDYLSSRKNLPILEAFVRSFHFSNMRIDEALRQFLESFRLPGEAPVISTIMENFAEHWRASNNNQFADNDAAYTLAYAIIMLNVDQHNRNVKKQSIPMTVEDFKKNLLKCNGGGNFDPELIEEIYTTIKHEEIIMPAEHTGHLRDSYLWKVLIRRARNNEDVYIHAPAGSYNHEIFNIVWGQTISALSFVYDKSLELSVIQKAINGFTKCAQLAAHYEMSDVFDNIVISLCKFSTLSTAQQLDNVDQLAVNFGMNNKAQLACRTVFQLTHNHGDILRDGWRNILDCIIQLYKAKLLPKVLIECEDFLHPEGRIKLQKDDIPSLSKTNSESSSGIFSSFFPWSADVSSNRGPTPEEQEATKNAQACIDECHIGQLIHDTKFLRVDSLLELVKALIYASQMVADATSLPSNASLSPPNSNSASGSLVNSTSGSNLVSLGATSGTVSPTGSTDIDAAVFSLEILIKVVLQNRDRINCIWPLVRNHFCNIIVNASEHSFFFERAVVGLIRICARLLRREELANEVLSSLRILLMIKKRTIILRVSRQVTYGLHDLLRTSAANIQSNDDWSNIFTILQVFGAGASTTVLTMRAPSFASKTQIDDETSSITSESATTFSTESDYMRPKSPDTMTSTAISDYEQELLRTTSQNNNLANQYKIDLDDISLTQHDKKAFAKSCETLTFLIRDMAHISLQNFESCIQCLRTFVEACVLGDRTRELKKTDSGSQLPAKGSRFGTNARQQQTLANKKQQQQRPQSPQSDSDEDDQFITSYETISTQLLDLLDTLHIKAASIFTIWAEEQRHMSSQQTAIFDSVVSNLWSKCWCPILQGIARLCCDSNGEVRMHALQYLQRALLVHELQTLSAMEWEACFNKVLFPLLAKLLENIDPRNAHRMEETRMRASSLLCKVFLQHLTTLARLSTFTALWLTILDYMDKYMKSDKSDLLHDVIPESLKNMLLVMETTGLYSPSNQDIKFSQLRVITKDRIESFLPGLWDDVFKTAAANNASMMAAAQAAAQNVAATAVVNGGEVVNIEPQPLHKSPSVENISEIVRASSPTAVYIEKETLSPTKSLSRSNSDIKDL